MKKTVDPDIYEFFAGSLEGLREMDASAEEKRTMVDQCLRFQEIRSQNIIADSFRPTHMELKPGQIHFKPTSKKS